MRKVVKQIREEDVELIYCDNCGVELDYCKLGRLAVDLVVDNGEYFVDSSGHKDFCRNCSNVIYIKLKKAIEDLGLGIEFPSYLKILDEKANAILKANDAKEELNQE